MVSKLVDCLQGSAILAALAFAPLTMSADDGHWVGTWGTAPQLVESYNNPPSPGLQNNSLRQIVQVSIGGETVRLRLTNAFSTAATEIKAVELAHATTAGSSSGIDEATTVSLTFDGSPSVTMAAGGSAVSDPVKFHIDARQNVAVTIHYGQASSTSVSGHPGSRTTSYIKAGNTTDFSGATTTDHWYTILSLDVMAPAEAGAVAILGNSITDGRGSTTNQQNRWPDGLSRRLLGAGQGTVGVLNMGIGGNCVLSGGLGPTAQSRYGRDLFEQSGVKWVILFEAVNDLGSAADGVQTAQRIIDVYRQIIREAHQRGIRVFGATITPFKGNSYYSSSHEAGRQVINDWILTTPMIDGTIDFAAAVSDPQDAASLQSQYLFENDHLHLNAAGYEAMAAAVDLGLFTLDGPLAADDDGSGDDDSTDDDALWVEAENLVTPTCGYNFRDIIDAGASGGHYLETSPNIISAAPTDSASMLVWRFTLPTSGSYHVYGRVNCPTWDDDSYWIKLDDGNFSNFVNGLCTNGAWEWKELIGQQLTAGSHSLTLGCREDGARLDKLCITLSATPPTGMGGTPTAPGDGNTGNDNPGTDDPGTDTPKEGLDSNLPIVIITTDKAINADAKVQGHMKIINRTEPDAANPAAAIRNNEHDAPTDYDGYIGIKWRGNSSLSFAQKKYTIETQDEEGNDLKAPLFGMPDESDWVLDAPYNDLSLLRDVFAFNLWNEMGHWGPRTQFCEVIVNGEYMGVYVFCEKIKRDKERVDIAKLKTDDIEGRELTGGYIVRVDAYDDDDATFTSKVKGIPESNSGWGGWWGGSTNTTVTWTVYHPKKEKLQPEQKTYIQAFVDKMEQAFQAQNFTDPDEGYARYIDVPSFVDYFIHTELSLNADGYKRSSYFHKDKDAADGTEGKMFAGPVWDYNLAYGDCNFCNANNVKAWVYEGCTTNPTPAFWKKLTTDPAFMEQVRQRYAYLRHDLISLERIDSFFDDYANLLDEAKERHYAKYSNLFVDSSQQGGGGWWWGGGTTSPISYFAAYYVASYEEEIATVKDWFRQRIAFLDQQWQYDPEASAINGLRTGSAGRSDSNASGYFSATMTRTAEGLLTVAADRPLSRIDVYSLSGRHLAAYQSAAPSSSTVQFASGQETAPVIVVCEADDGAYVTRKVQ